MHYKNYSYLVNSSKFKSCLKAHEMQQNVVFSGIFSKCSGEGDSPSQTPSQWEGRGHPSHTLFPTTPLASQMSLPKRNSPLDNPKSAPATRSAYTPAYQFVCITNSNHNILAVTAVHKCQEFDKCFSSY